MSDYKEFHMPDSWYVQPDPGPELEHDGDCELAEDDEARFNDPCNTECSCEQRFMDSFEEGPDPDNEQDERDEHDDG